MKTYLMITPNPNGTHNDQTNNFFEKDGIPEGWIEIPDSSLSAWEKYKPFVKLAMEDGKIMAIEDNVEARAAAKATADAAQAAADKQKQIDDLKAKLTETDYAVIKIAEGVATKEEYAEIITNRAAWRSEINALERLA